MAPSPWYLSSSTGRPFVLMNARTGRILDSNDAGAVRGITANGGNYQNWTATALPQLGPFAL